MVISLQSVPLWPETSKTSDPVLGENRRFFSLLRFHPISNEYRIGVKSLGGYAYILVRNQNIDSITFLQVKGTVTADYGFSERLSSSND